MFQWLVNWFQIFCLFSFNYYYNAQFLLYADVFKQWLCNADKSSHEPRLRLKYVKATFYLLNYELCFLIMIEVHPWHHWWWNLRCLFGFSFNVFVIIFRAFFGSLYRCLARGARAVLQVYPENIAQRELILSFAMRAGFAGGVVVDYPHRYAIYIPVYIYVNTLQEIERCCIDIGVA